MCRLLDFCLYFICVSSQNIAPIAPIHDKYTSNRILTIHLRTYMTKDTSNPDPYCRYTMNFYATINEPIDETERYKQWINDTLREARKNNEKVRKLLFSFTLRHFKHKNHFPNIIF